MQELIEFEARSNFDRNITIRLSIRKRIDLETLKSFFADYQINWEATEFMFRKGVDRVQYFYLKCGTNEDAKRIYENRAELCIKMGGYLKQKPLMQILSA